MRPRDQRQMIVTMLLVVVTLAAFALVLVGVEIAAVKELLAIIFPSLVALAAAGVGRETRP